MKNEKSLKEDLKKMNTEMKSKLLDDLSFLELPIKKNAIMQIGRNEDNEIMMITTEGIIIRISCSDISILGRITSGVKLMNLDENVSVASIAKVREKKDANLSEEEPEEENPVKENGEEEIQQ